MGNFTNSNLVFGFIKIPSVFLEDLKTSPAMKLPGNPLKISGGTQMLMRMAWLLSMGKEWGGTCGSVRRSLDRAKDGRRVG